MHKHISTNSDLYNKCVLKGVKWAGFFFPQAQTGICLDIISGETNRHQMEGRCSDLFLKYQTDSCDEKPTGSKSSETCKNKI